MTLRRAFACAAAALAVLAAASAADARPAVFVDAGRLSFFADLPGIIARDRVRIAAGDGLALSGESAYLDLHANRIVVAGGARVTRGSAALEADVIAVDLRAGRVDALRAASGAERYDARLAGGTSVAIETDRFGFPDIDDARAYIRAKRATITPDANARFSPAAFPNSPGAVPVPSYLYTFATNPSFGTSAFGGATFDQPYGLIGGTTSLLAAHFRYEDGTGATIGLDDHHVYGDNAYVVTAVDSPLRSNRAAQLTAYERMGPHLSHALDASAAGGFGAVHYALSDAFGGGSGSRLDLSRAGSFTSGNVNLHTADRRVIGALTAQLNADAGFDAAPGGVLSALPDAKHYATLWRHALGAFVSAPAVKGPFGTSVGSTLRLSRTWYAFPHQYDTASASVTASRGLARNLRAFAVYTAAYAYDIYPTAQGRFYPAPATTFAAPDGTPWPGYAAFSGASSQRGLNVDLTYAHADTNLRLSIAHADDFPQFHGYGRAPYQLRIDGRVRPLPNVGLAFGRSYGFGWGGQRFSRWSFSVLP